MVCVFLTITIIIRGLQRMDQKLSEFAFFYNYGDISIEEEKIREVKFRVIED